MSVFFAALMTLGSLHSPKVAIQLHDFERGKSALLSLVPMNFSKLLIKNVRPSNDDGCKDLNVRSPRNRFSNSAKLDSVQILDGELYGFSRRYVTRQHRQWVINSFWYYKFVAVERRNSNLKRPSKVARGGLSGVSNPHAKTWMAKIIQADTGLHNAWVASSLRFANFTRDTQSLTTLSDCYEEEGSTYCRNGKAPDAEPESSSCPQGARFSGPRCLPLGAQIAFVVPAWCTAWFAILYGLGLVGKRRPSRLWIVGGIAVALMPFVFGVL